MLNLGKTTPLIVGILAILVGSTNAFGFVALGDVGQGIVIAAGTLATVGALSAMLKLKGQMGAIVSGALTVLVGMTGFFGLVDLSTIGSGIVIAFGVLAIIGGIFKTKIGI